MATVSLRRFTQPPLALEIRPLARLERGGWLLPASPVWLPHEGRCTLVLWRPGPEEPAFSHAEGRLERQRGGWRFLGEAAEGWLVHVIPSPRA